uniref:AlNc14C461G11782 protein n=1 Tax=Albugo laibachii Nc14 TaxID=890382 RepID=F0X044_9STRA|nr:AlNc14C461G11782 [Albugo laibachii Nc14]|eukprot:CCA27126.1 AlNc14C461G11782 [Albugo laibachii Nc14]
MEAIRMPRRQPFDSSSLNLSNGWLARVLVRHCVKSRFEHGEAGSYDPIAVVRGQITCQDAIRCYAKLDVYKLGEDDTQLLRTPSTKYWKQRAYKRAQIEREESDCAAVNECQWSQQAATVIQWQCEEATVLCGRLASYCGLSYFSERNGLDAGGPVQCVASCPRRHITRAMTSRATSHG